MRLILLGIAALTAAVAAAPACAIRPVVTFRAAPGVHVHRGGDFGSRHGTIGDHRRGGYGYGDFYPPYREYQGDTLFRRDSFNDWWHSSPERSIPRWVTNNATCERQYWTGGGWRC